MQMVPTLKTLARLLEKGHLRSEYILTSLVDCYIGAQETVNQDSSTGAHACLQASQSWPSVFFSTTPEEQSHFTTIPQPPGLWQSIIAE